VASVEELSAFYASFMLGPRPGPGVCPRCFDLVTGAEGCYRCARYGGWVDAASPISYSVAGGPLHRALRSYKRLTGTPARWCTVGVAALLWRHLELHEHCLACAAGVDGFDVVTTVPSSDRARGESHPLHQLVGELVGPVRDRYERLLRRTGAHVAPHQFNIHKYEAIGRLGGQSVLLLDDTWTTGANAQSAAAALKRAGARTVAAVAVGRYVNPGYGANDERLRSMRGFDWAICAWCGVASQTARRRQDRR
jgi:predicted amidophosphoribosyltransferase